MGRTIRLNRSFVVARRQEDVFDWMADLRNDFGPHPDLQEVELVGGTSVGPGAVFSARLRRLGRLEVRVVDYARPWQLGFRATGKAEVLYEFRFVPVDGGTRVETTAEAPQRGAARLLAPLTRALNQRWFEARGRRLKQALERHLPAPPTTA